MRPSFLGQYETTHLCQLATGPRKGRSPLLVYRDCGIAGRDVQSVTPKLRKCEWIPTLRPALNLPLHHVDYSVLVW